MVIAALVQYFDFQFQEMDCTVLASRLELISLSLIQELIISFECHTTLYQNPGGWNPMQPLFCLAWSSLMNGRQELLARQVSWVLFSFGRWSFILVVCHQIFWFIWVYISYFNIIRLPVGILNMCRKHKDLWFGTSAKSQSVVWFTWNHDFQTTSITWRQVDRI